MKNWPQLFYYQKHDPSQLCIEELALTIIL